jgi:hypothetical protein
VNKALSASEVDIGFRLQTPFLTRLVDAEASYLYLSRGSKSAGWPVKVFARRPFYYLGKDLSRNYSQLVAHPNWGSWWTNPYSYSTPYLNQANDTLGILVDWPRVRAGLEYFACSDTAAAGFRPFQNGVYITGFYYYGDTMRTAVGGEAITTTARLEVDCTPRVTAATTVMRGFRPFRDTLSDWQLDHPGQTPAKNRFTVVQQTLNWKAGPLTTWGLGASWQRVGAEENVAGAEGNGFAWFADASFRWPPRR